MRRLIIAEKPSVARAIVAVIGPGIGKRQEGFIECIEYGTRITWCYGHMYEYADPDEYLPDNVPLTKSGKKVWRVEDLPIIPKEWRVHPRKDARDQLKTIMALIKEADELVHAGDPDREGQLLVDEVIEQARFKGRVLRFWVSAQDAESVRKGLDNLKDNKEYVGWRDSARARARADWLVGYNLSRAYALRAQRGYSSVRIAVGRVKSPTLAMVVARDLAIDGFKPQRYFAIKASIHHQEGDFFADYKPQEGQQGLDSENRLSDHEMAKSIASSVQGQTGTVIRFETKQKNQGHPLPFSLAGITLAAANQYGYSAEQVLQVCQHLYENKLITYPRTDCSYLPESQHGDVPAIMEAIGMNCPQYGHIIAKIDPGLKSRAWNDSKITAHHGIIPTRQHAAQGDQEAAQIYDLIVKRYLAQFLPVHEYLSTNVELDVSGYLFSAHGKVVTTNGWKDVDEEAEEVAKKDDDGDESQEQKIPAMGNGDAVTCHDVKLTDKKTKPPPRYNEGTLIRDMETIHKIVNDPEHKIMLKESDGIGTPATRATLIKELRDIGYLVVEGKKIVSTEIGRQLVANLPDAIRDPVMTAVNERMLKDIQGIRSSAESADKVRDFLNYQIGITTDMVREANEGSCLIGEKSEPKRTGVVSDEFSCQVCGKPLIRRINQKGNPWWGCSGFPGCKERYFDRDGKPDYNGAGTKKVNAEAK
jgi:DNA topoisomerase-3